MSGGDFEEFEKLEAKVRVIYGDTDQMGVVYYANYLRYFERARSEYLRAHGGDYRELEKSGHFLPVVEASCRYRAPARYDDLLTIRTRIAEVRRSAVTFEYEVFREGATELLASGRTQHVCTNRAGKAVRLPESFMKRLERSPAVSSRAQGA